MGGKDGSLMVHQPTQADEFILSKAIFNDLAFMEYKIDVSDNDWFVRSMCKLESFCY